MPFSFQPNSHSHYRLSVTIQALRESPKDWVEAMEMAKAILVAEDKEDNCQDQVEEYPQNLREANPLLLGDCPNGEPNQIRKSLRKSIYVKSSIE